MSAVAESPTAAAVVSGYLSRQVAVLRGLEDALGRGAPGAVHDTRVATRRIRCTVKTFGALLGPGDRAPLLESLRWWGGVVGALRDVQVLHLRWQPMLAELADVVAAEGVAWLDAELGSRGREALEELRLSRASARHAELVRSLGELVGGGATQEGLRPAEDVLPALVRRACRRMDRAARRVEAAGTEHARAHRLHQVRKAAKRARYAAELCAPALGAPAADLAERMEAVQEVLGERQDSAHAQAVLLSMMGNSLAGSAEGFVCGAIWSAERQLSGAAEDVYEVALHRAEERAVRHWLG
jgi:CHAD domain-containing protein